MVWSYGYRPDDTVFVVVLFYYCGQGSGNTDTVAAHYDQLILLVFILVSCIHCCGVLGAQLEYLTYFDTSCVLDWCAAYRTCIANLQSLQVAYDVALVVSAVVYILNVVICLASTCTQVLQANQFAVYYNLAVVQTYRTCEAANCTCYSTHLFFVSEFDGVFRNVQSVYQLNHVQFAVASDESSYVTVLLAFFVISYEQQSLDGLFLRQTQEVSNFFDSLGTRSVYFFHFQHCYIVAVCCCIHTCCSFYSCSHFTAVAVCDFTFTDFRQCSEFVGTTAADSTGVSFYRTELQTASGKYSFVSFIHFIVALVQTFVVLVEGVSVLHDELTASHQTESRTSFVSVLGLNLIQVHRQLSVGSYVVSDNVSEYFFVSWTQAEFSLVSVLYSPHFRTVCEPSAGFLPQFCRLQSGHVNFLCALAIHFLTDDVFNLADGSPAQRHEAVNTGNQLSDHAGSQQQNMAGNFCFIWNFS